MSKKKAVLSDFLSAFERKPVEDVITSTIFGPLSFFCRDDIGYMFENFLKIFGVQDFSIYSELPITIEFWENIKTQKYRKRHVQPDVVIKAGNSIRILIEVKWESVLSESELAAQWLALSKDEMKNSFHLLITRRARNDYTECIRRDAVLINRCSPEWESVRFRHVKWSDISSFLAALISPPDCVNAWTALVLKFLQGCSIIGIRAWDAIGIAEVGELSWRFGAAPNPD